MKLHLNLTDRQNYYDATIDKYGAFLTFKSSQLAQGPFGPRPIAEHTVYATGPDLDRLVAMKTITVELQSIAAKVNQPAPEPVSVAPAALVQITEPEPSPEAPKKPKGPKFKAEGNDLTAAEVQP